jgi:hypothetical protein
MAERVRRPRTRRFLSGLSLDELQYLAGLLGGALLEGGVRGGAADTVDLSWLAPDQGRCPAPLSDDRCHKLLLLREFLCRSGIEPVRAKVRVARV